MEYVIGEEGRRDPLGSEERLRGAPEPLHETPTPISHQVFLKSFCKSQFPYKSFNLIFI